MIQEEATVRAERSRMGSSFSNTNEGKRTSHYAREAGLLFQGSVKNSTLLYESLQKAHKAESVLLNKSLKRFALHDSRGRNYDNGKNDPLQI